MITRRLALTALAALCASTLARANNQRIAPWDPVIPTPALDLMSVDGARWSLADLRGKVGVLNFWATWCEPCLAEMPQLSALARRHEQDGQLAVLGINYREGVSAIQRFGAGKSPGFPILRDVEGMTFKAWRGTILPTTVLVSRDGRARFLIQGELDWESTAATDMLGALLAEPASETDDSMLKSHDRQ